MVVLITGTGKGLGSGLAVHYLEKGHTVYGISRSNNTTLEKYQKFHFLSQDLAEFDRVNINIPPFLEKAGMVDLAILNAGILPEIKDLGDCTLEEIYRVMDINVWSNKILIDILFALPNPPRQVVAVSSGASVLGNRGWNSYAISKAALNMLIKLYAEEHPGTHFSSVAPGLIDSAMQEYIFSLPDDHKYPSLDKLKQVKSSGEMPSPLEAAGILADSIIKARDKESGSFLDVREM